MTDIHSHILQNIDDGAVCIQQALKLLHMQQSDGVSKVMLTPHCNVNMIDIEKFIDKRACEYQKLMEHAKGFQIEISLGAEVMFSPQLLDIDLAPLCYSGTKNILIELPWSNLPPLLAEVLSQIKLSGYTPVLAHVERYRYLMRNLDLLKKLVRAGIYTHVNAESIIYNRKIALNLIKGDLAHMVASDAHSVDIRPPLLGKAMGIIRKKLGQNTAEMLIRNANAIVKSDW